MSVFIEGIGLRCKNLCIVFVVFVSCIFLFIYNIGCLFCVSKVCVFVRCVVFMCGMVGGVKFGKVETGVLLSCMFLVMFISMGLGWLVCVILNVLVNVGVSLLMLVIK